MSAPPPTTVSSILNHLQGLSIYLVGMMGAGKSTAGRTLARNLGYRFFDTDDLIERVAGKSIPDIFASDGEAAFRELESQVLAQLTGCTRSVIATGGGIVLARKNWSCLHQGLSVWLDAPVEVLMQRLARDRSRPLLQVDDPAAKLTELLESRRVLYAEADLRVPISVEDTPTTVVARAIALFPSILRTDTGPGNAS